MPKGKPAEGEAPGNGSDLTKSEAVRQAIGAGITSPKQGVEYVKATYGLVVTAGLYSNIKSTLAKRFGNTNGRRVGRPRKTPESAPVASNGGNVLEVARAGIALQGLVSQLGKNVVQEIVRGL